MHSQTKWINPQSTHQLTSPKLRHLTKKYGDKIRIYPGSMELRDGKNYALKSRAIGILASATASRKHAKSAKKAPKQSLAAHSGTEPTLPQNNISPKASGTWSS